MKSLLISSVTLLCLVAGTFAQKEMVVGAVIKGDTVNGNVTFRQSACGQPVLVQVYITGLKAGLHGFHVHEKGDLSNGCTSLGAHFNPDKLDHGAPHSEVRHIGDLGNINASENGVAETQFSDPLLQLSGPRSIIGRGIIVHELPDDLGQGNNNESKKTGNAGARLGCGVIGIFEPFEENWPCTSGGNGRYVSFTLLILASVAASWLKYVVV